MKCPACDNEGDIGAAFDSNDGKVNYGLVYSCRNCGEHIDTGSGDGCGDFVPIDTMTDEEPFLCLSCVELANLHWNQGER